MEAGFLNIKKVLSETGPEEGLQYLSSFLGNGVAFSSSLGLEDQVITHWIGVNRLDLKIFTIDTGRLFQETYDLLDITRKKYDVRIQTYFPDPSGVEALISEKGPNSFYDSVKNRKECCYLRKIEPLKRALSGVSVWITGIRAGQSENRRQMEIVEWDETYKVVKYNPLLNWTKDEVMSFIESNKVPINVLHNKGFPSIGCAPCTRSILPGEDDRAGRWWWETSNKECGLHDRKQIRSEK